ncbi:MAG: hypothetical protein LBE12_13325, partial [Planctomycetaceae bacterium]|nr:hypothetical protein [Planctomycetaceae bacterium]
MVRLVRDGQSRRSVVRQFNVSEKQVRYWCVRAGDHRLDRVDWTDHRVTKSRTHN